MKNVARVVGRGAGGKYASAAKVAANVIGRAYKAYKSRKGVHSRAMSHLPRAHK